MDAHISIHGEGELGISAGLFAALLIVLIAAPGSLLPVGGRETVIDENVWANRLADWLQGVFLESRVSEDDVAYEASGGGMQARLSSEGIQLLIEADEAPIRISLVGANAVEPRGSVVTDARLYSFRGSPAGLGFRAYESVVYPAIYPGIDLVFETTREGLKYEFRLAPGANPGRIALAYDTGTTLRLREDGALAIRRGNTVLLDAPPSAFQPSGPVPCQYDLITTYSHGFRCWNWNPSEPLVITPSCTRR